MSARAGEWPSGPLDWEVRLPKKGETILSGRRPRARVTVRSESHGEETFSVPTVVGRKLDAKARSGELVPGSRAELLFEIRSMEQSSVSGRVETLVNRRDYSSSQLSQKLSDDGFPKDIVDSAVKRAVECGLVDDIRFAGSFIRSGVSRGWGRQRIERELSRRGVNAEDVPGWPEEFISEGDEADRAYELASRRHLTGKNDYQKIVRFLVGRGYSISLATQTARRVLDEAREDEGL